MDEETRRRLAKWSREYDGVFEAVNDALSVFRQHQDEIRKAIALVRGHFSELPEILSTVTKSYQAFAQVYLKNDEKAKLLLEAGVMPSSTTPWHLITKQMNNEEVREVVLEHYTQNWESASENLKYAVARLNLDQESKDAFGEALRSHASGFYRAVVRTLMCEIERAVRVNLRSNGFGSNIPKDFLQSIGEQPAGAVMIFESGHRIYGKLDSHLYASIKTEPQRDVFVNDPIPNRHAAVHGLIVYNKPINSLNAIFMTAFLFHQLSLMTQMIEDPTEG